MMADEWVGWGKKTAAPSPQAQPDWTGWGKKRPQDEVPTPSPTQSPTASPPSDPKWTENARAMMTTTPIMAGSTGVGTPRTDEDVANAQRTALVRQLPPFIQQRLAESEQVNPGVGTLEDGPRPDPFAAVLGALPARGGVGRALRSGLVATAEGVVEPLANIASPLSEAVGGPELSGAPEGLGAVFNATDPPQTSQERIGDVVGRIGSIPVQFAAMGGFNPVGAATKAIGGMVPKALKLPAEIGVFTGIQQAGQVASHGQDPLTAAATTAMSTPDMILHAGESVPAAIRAAAQPGTGMERLAGAVEAGEPGLALLALAAKDRVPAFLRRLIGGRGTNNAEPGGAGNRQRTESGLLPDSLQSERFGTGEPDASVAPRLNLTPDQLAAGQRSGLITDAPIQFESIPANSGIANDPRVSVAAGGISGVQKPAQAITQTTPPRQTTARTGISDSDAVPNTGETSNLTGALRLLNQPAPTQLTEGPTNAPPPTQPPAAPQAGKVAAQAEVQAATSSKEMGANPELPGPGGSDAAMGLPPGYAVEKTLPGKTMTDAEIKASQKKKYNRGSRDESLAAAIGVSARTGKPAYVYATNAGFKVESAMPSLPSGNRFFEVTSDGKSYGGRILTVGEATPRPDTPGPVTQKSDSAAAPGTVVNAEPISTRDYELTARNLSDSGSRRFKDMDWNIRGNNLEAYHAITSRKIGMIDLKTGQIIPDQSKYAEKMQQLDSHIRQEATTVGERQRLENLLKYPARNQTEIDAIVAANPSLRSSLPPFLQRPSSEASGQAAPAPPASPLSNVPSPGTPPANTAGESVPPGGDFTFSANDISRELATRAHSGTSHTPERRGEYEQQQYVNHMQAVKDHFMAKVKTPEQRAQLIEELNRYKQGFIQRKNAVLSARSRVMSSMITGPARFPVESNRKKSDSADRRMQELIDWEKKAQAAITRNVFPEAAKSISSDNPNAPELLQKKIEEAETLQARMVAGNKIVRNKKLTDAEKIEQLKALGLREKTAIEALKPDFAGRRGFPDYALQNNLANIKRMKGRVANIEQARTTDTTETTMGEARVVDSVEDNRLQLFFDGKPSEAMRSKLKSAGFKWAPSVGAWQRFRGPGAMDAAKRILGESKPALPPDPTEAPDAGASRFPEVPPDPKPPTPKLYSGIPLEPVLEGAAKLPEMGRNIVAEVKESMQRSKRPAVMKAPDFVRRAIGSTYGNVAATGEAGENFAYKVKFAEEMGRIAGHKADMAIEKALSKSGLGTVFGRDEFLSIGKKIENGEPLTPKQKIVADEWTKQQTAALDMAESVGMQVFDPKLGEMRPVQRLGERFFPNMPKRGIVENLMHDLKSGNIAAGDHPPSVLRKVMRGNALNTVVDHWIEKGIAKTREEALVKMNELFDPSLNGFFAGGEMARGELWPEGYRENNPARAMKSYLAMMWRRIGEVGEFGQNETALKAHLKAIELESPMKLRSRNTRQAEDFYKRVFGQDWVNPIANIEGNYTTLTKMALGFNAIKQLSTGGTTAAVFGPIKTLKGMAKQFSDPETRRIVRESGAIQEDYYQNFADTVDRGIGGTLTSAGLKLSGITAADKLMRNTHGATTLWALRDGIKHLRDKPTGFESNRMRRLFTDQLEVPEATVNEWTKTGEIPKDWMDRLLVRSVRRFQFENDPFTRTVWGHSAFGRMMTRLKSFSIQQARLWATYVIPEARRGNLWPIVAIVGASVGTGELYTAIRNKALGRDRPDEDLLTRLGNDIISAGTFGLLTDVLRTNKSGDVVGIEDAMMPSGLESVKNVATGINRALIQPPKRDTKLNVTDRIKRQLDVLAGREVTVYRNIKEGLANRFKGGITPNWWTRKAPYNPANAEKRKQEIAKRKAREAAKAR